MRVVSALLATCILLAACGQRGDLYFPEQEREAVTTPASSAAPAQSETEEQRRLRNSGTPPANTPPAPAAGAN